MRNLLPPPLSQLTTSEPIAKSRAVKNNPKAADLAKKITKQSRYFIPNKGQWPSEVLYLAKVSNLNYWITKHGVTYDFFKTKKQTSNRSDQNLESAVDATSTTFSREGHVIQTEIEGMNSSITPKEEKIVDTKLSYFIGNDKSKWNGGIRCFLEITLPNIISNIDMKYYFDEGNIRYDYIVQPGGNIKDIHLKFSGTNNQWINSKGEFVFTTRFGEVSQAKLFTYQNIDGKKKEVPSNFKIDANGTVSFEVTEYDHELPLVIDPIIWCTYLGGGILDLTAADVGLGIVVDETTGNVYVSGMTQSTDFPTTTGSYDNTISGSQDGCISKFDPTGTFLLASTFYGGTGSDEFSSIDFNYNTHNVFVTGRTGSNDFPTIPSSTFNPAGEDIVVVIIDENLTSPIVSTIFGGPGSDRGWCIKSIQSVSDNSYYICGGSPFSTGSFPSITELVGTPAPTSNHPCGFVTKVDFTTAANSWVRYLYGTASQGETAMDLELEIGYVFVAGRTQSTDFSTPATYDLPSGTTGMNGFITRMTGVGNLDYSTIVGGNYHDEYHSIDAYEGMPYACGSSYSNNLLGALNSNTGASNTCDIFLTNFTLAGARINNRYLGGTGTDIGTGIEVNNNVVVITGGISPIGFTSNTVCNNSSTSNVYNVVVARYSTDLTTLNYCRSFGSNTYNDLGYEIRLVADNDFYIVGTTDAVSAGPPYIFPVTHAAYDISFNGFPGATSSSSDLFVMHLTTDPIVIDCATSTTQLCPNSTVGATLTPSGADVYTVSPGSTAWSPNPVVVYPTATTTYTITGADALDQSCTATTTITITVNCDCNNAPSGTPVYTDIAASTLPSGSLSSPIIFNGTFTIDGATSIIDNPDVYFLPNSKIVLGSGETLTITHSELDGCLSHWDGIYVADAGTTLIINDNVNGRSVLSHMTKGVQASEWSTVQVSNSDFFDNAISSFYFYNMDFLGTGSFLNGNRIQGTNNPLWPPFVTQLRPKHGVDIYDCWNVEIGDIASASLGNIFAKLFNGIRIIWDVVNTTENYGIHNNLFSDIKNVAYTGPYYDKNVLNFAYSYWEGAAIYTYAAYTIPSVFDLNVVVDYSPQPNPMQFINSDKAIVTNLTNLTTNRVKMNNCLLGIMNRSSGNQYTIQNSEINNVHAGIQFLNPYDVMNVSYNDITLSTPVQYGAAQWHAPIGIRVFDTYLGIPSSSILANNNIDINTPAGIGIENIEGKSGMGVNQNYIRFLTTYSSSTATTGWDNDMLIGIRNLRSSEVSMADNRVDGINEFTYSAAFQARKSCGYYYENTADFHIACNKVKYTWYGFYSNGQNLAIVNDNKCRNNIYPWFFNQYGGAPSSFGPVGSLTFDNANDFIFGGAASPSYSGFKVYRFDSNPTGYVISTSSSLLTFAESGASAAFSEYPVTTTSLIGIPPTCLTDLTFGQKQTSANYSFETLEHFLNIANDLIAYQANQPVGKWLDQVYLYSILDADADLRTSNNAYLNFYNNNLSSAIGKLVEADKKIKALNELTGNGQADYQKYDAAIQANNEIPRSSMFSNNARLINSMLIQSYYFGYNSLTTNQKNIIDDFSHRCPHNDGDAVFKARLLWAYLTPTESFDDREICFSGSSKDSDFDYDIYAMALIKGSNEENTQEEGPIVYPNPTSKEVNIVFANKSVGEFVLLDCFGKIVYKTGLQSNTYNQKIELPRSLANGLYYYQCRYENELNFVGKLNVVR